MPASTARSAPIGDSTLTETLERRLRQACIQLQQIAWLNVKALNGVTIGSGRSSGYSGWPTDHPTRPHPSTDTDPGSYPGMDAYARLSNAS